MSLEIAVTRAVGSAGGAGAFLAAVPGCDAGAVLDAVCDFSLALSAVALAGAGAGAGCAAGDCPNNGVAITTNTTAVANICLFIRASAREINRETTGKPRSTRHIRERGAICPERHELRRLPPSDHGRECRGCLEGSRNR